jgi:hypothetical protein
MLLGFDTCIQNMDENLSKVIIALGTPLAGTLGSTIYARFKKPRSSASMDKSNPETEHADQSDRRSMHRPPGFWHTVASFAASWLSLTAVVLVLWSRLFPAPDRSWEPFSNNIKVVLENQDRYEYACFRNGGFRRLTASNWNNGWTLVMTEPYAQGQPPATPQSNQAVSGPDHLTIGGSMWAWQTPLSEVCHYYYRLDSSGLVVMGGNLLTKAGSELSTDELRKMEPSWSPEESDNGRKRIFRRLR